MTALAITLQAFFTDRLVCQRQVSQNTIAAYRDTLRLLLVFAADKKSKEPSRLEIDDLDAPLVGSFLDDLEERRKNGALRSPSRARDCPMARASATSLPACVSRHESGPCQDGPCS